MKRLSIFFSLFMGLALSQSVSAYKESDLRKLLNTNSCSRCDLRAAKLSGANLSRANLSGSSLSGVNLNGANLFLADLRGANLRLADLTGASLESTQNTSEAIVCNTTMPDGTKNNSGC